MAKSAVSRGPSGISHNKKPRESGVLRDLHKVQVAIPDKYFFANLYRGEGGKKKKAKEAKRSFFGGKKKAILDLAYARELIKAFHNSFLANKEAVEDGRITTASGIMSVAKMNEFRGEVREAAHDDPSDSNYQALDAIIRYIDIKNSGILKDKQVILQDCVKKVGEALQQEGGLSMFHTTWFLSIYKDYLSSFRMFRKGELASARQSTSSEAKAIARELTKKQFEIPHYLILVDQKTWEVRQITQYSLSEGIKRSIHGQKGCTKTDIQRIFHERFAPGGKFSVEPGQVNEVNIIMAYALLFAKVPMMYELVEYIKSAIPNLNVDTTLHKQKIAIAQRICLLDIASGAYQGDGSRDFFTKQFDLALSVHNYCASVIQENRLETIPFKSEIYAHPFLKQAGLLITYKKVFQTNKKVYKELLNKSLDKVHTVKASAAGGNPGLQKIASHLEVYEKNIETILKRVDRDNPEE